MMDASKLVCIISTELEFSRLKFFTCLILVRVLFGWCPGPSRNEDLKPFSCCFLRDWAWFTATKWANYKLDGAQSRNPTTHTYYQTRNICIEQQESIKEQCDRERHKVNVGGP